MNEPDPIAAAVTALVSALVAEVRREIRVQTVSSPPEPRRGHASDSDEGPLLLTLVEARTQLRISKATLDRLLKQGRIRKVKIGARAFVALSEVERFIAESAG